MDYKRVFCFGCSWTYYSWPTWADILRKDLDIPVQNWGIGGLGNVGIFCRMVECDIINTFTDEDLIIVVWSSWTREDRYIDGKWHNMGNVHNQEKDSIYDNNFIKKYWDWGNDIIKNSTAIISANKMFNIFGNFSIVPMNSPEDIIINHSDPENEMIEFYFKDFPNIKQFNKPKSKIYDWVNGEVHPHIIAHSNFIKDEIYSKLGITMKSTTEKDIQSYQDAIIKELKELTKETIEKYLGVEKFKNNEIEKSPIQMISILMKSYDSSSGLSKKSNQPLVSNLKEIANSLWESNNWKKNQQA